ncbi:MAG: hypothetical protein C0424_08680 [Sphingobacteriaceae bacterium]|nr:hypothetical protein [Sphingobacteriaceae bacterium]
MKSLRLVLLLLLIQLGAFAQSRHVSESTKRMVFTRDGGVCQCCGGTENLEFDHIVPFSCGGGNEASNIQLLCRSCNRSKSNSCTCKIHNRKVGRDCCDGQSVTKASPNKSTAVQCSGTTKKGNRCKNRTTNSNGRCHLH